MAFVNKVIQAVIIPEEIANNEVPDFTGCTVILPYGTLFVEQQGNPFYYWVQKNKWTGERLFLIERNRNNDITRNTWIEIII